MVTPSCVPGPVWGALCARALHTAVAPISRGGGGAAQPRHGRPLGFELHWLSFRVCVWNLFSLGGMYCEQNGAARAKGRAQCLG